LRTPSFVSLRVPYHQRPCVEGSLSNKVSFRNSICRWAWQKRNRCTETDDKDRKDHSEQQGVRSDDEWRVLAFNDPCWQGDTGAELLLAVGVAVQLVIPPAHFVRETV
jgi:hypothetical protein